MMTEEKLVHVLRTMDITVNGQGLQATLEQDLGLDSAEITELSIALGDCEEMLLPPRYILKSDSLALVIEKMNLWITSGGKDEASV